MQEQDIVRRVYFYQTICGYSIVSYNPVVDIPQDIGSGDPKFRQQFTDKFGALKALVGHPWKPSPFSYANDPEMMALRQVLQIKVHPEDDVLILFEVPPFSTGEQGRKPYSIHSLLTDLLEAINDRCPPSREESIDAFIRTIRDP